MKNFLTSPYTQFSLTLAGQILRFILFCVTIRHQHKLTCRRWLPSSVRSSSLPLPRASPWEPGDVTETILMVAAQMDNTSEKKLGLFLKSGA